MKKFLLLLLIPIFQLVSSQITFGNYNYSFGPEPYTAQIFGQGTIYYTTDGTEPTVNSASAVNNLSISISAITTVKAILKNDANQLSQVFTKKYYFGQFPSQTVYFKKPPTWQNVCSFVNSVDPELPLDIYSGPPMTAVCEGWFKGMHAYFVGDVVFDNCIFPQIPPVYQFVNIVTENTVFYDYSVGPITNPPACLLAVNDSKKVAMVKVFPNPVQDFITIQSDKKFISYEIIDQSGRTIQSKSFNDSKIDVTQLTKGNYIIKLKSLSSVIDYVKFIKK